MTETPTVAAPKGGLITYLNVDGAIAAADFYKKAFRAEIVAQQPADDQGRTVARIDLDFAANATKGEGTLPAPPELRNRMARLDIEAQGGAGSMVLLDERSRRRPVSILGERPTATGRQIVVYILSLIPVTLMPFGLHMAGPSYLTIAGVLGLIFLGSAAWWLIFSLAKSWLRGHLQRGGLRVINLTAGTLICSFALWQFIDVLRRR